MLCRGSKHAVVVRCIAQRRFSDVHFGVTGSGLEELIDSSIDKQYRRKPDDGSQLRSTRKEALSLWRDILRYSRLWVWQDQTGEPWRNVLRTSARREFEAARQEQDPEVISRLLVAGRDAMQQAVDKFLAQRERIIREEQQRVAPPGAGDPNVLQ